MGTIELSLSPNYVPEWGLWESVREIIQNGLDAHDKGFELTVNRTRGGVLTVSNKGARLTRDTLLLGCSSKADDNDARGQFGEGYKLALSVLTRMGHDVTILTGTERWKVELSRSSNFGGAKTVKIKTYPYKRDDGVVVRIKGISEEDWELFQNQIRELGGKPVKRGVLLDRPGKIFVKGLYICTLDEYKLGYDFSHVSLDRDRKMANPYDLKTSVQIAVNEGVRNGKIPMDRVWGLVTNEEGMASGEGSDLVQYSYYSNPVSRTLAWQWTADYGNTVPCVSPEDVAQIGHFGIAGKVAPPHIVALLEREFGTYQDRVKTLELGAKRVWELGELEEEEKKNFKWGIDVVNLYRNFSAEYSFEVVDFHTDCILGTHSRQGGVEGRGQIRLARKLLTSRSELMSTLIHEVAHRYGGDGEKQHVQAIQNISAFIIAGMID